MMKELLRVKGALSTKRAELEDERRMHLLTIRCPVIIKQNTTLSIRAGYNASGRALSHLSAIVTRNETNIHLYAFLPTQNTQNQAFLFVERFQQR